MMQPVDLATMPVPAPHIAIVDLEDPRAYPHPVTSVTVLQTHISWVCLAGQFAYKIKKPVDFGFLDFSTLERRKKLCEEEVALNSRFAPDLYLGVVPITRTGTGLRFGGDGEAVEWAVRMQRFEQRMQLDERLAHGQLAADELIEFATGLAAIHGRLPRTTAADDFGTPAAVLGPVVENFEQIATTKMLARREADLARLEQWSRAEHSRLSSAFAARRARGFVRECHGDLHLSNLVLRDGRVVAFDCIEFNPGLRWIDVISDIAFLLMDLEIRHRADLAASFLDRYLEQTGDYAGAELLTFYRVYRSLVRAKVAALQHEGDAGDAVTLAQRFEDHIDYAVERAFFGTPMLFLTCGLSGSGKSWLSARLVPHLPAVRIRSDVERTRLSFRPAQRYTKEAITKTYEHLAQCADALLRGGVSVLVDATFIASEERERFTMLARRCGVPLGILYTTAPTRVLEARIRERATRGGDPSEADLDVLRAQREAFETPQGDAVLRVDTRLTLDFEEIAHSLRSIARDP